MKRYAVAVFEGRVIAINEERVQHSASVYTHAVVQFLSEQTFEALSWHITEKGAQSAAARLWRTSIKVFIVPVHITIFNPEIGEEFQS